MAIIAQGGSASRKPSGEPPDPQMEHILPYIDIDWIPYETEDWNLIIQL